jgi:alpha-glucosidase
MIKYPGLPDIPEGKKSSEMLAPHERPFWDQDGVHEIYRSWRKILDSYPGDRMAVAEAWVSPAERIARYVRSDELQNSFNFEMLTTLWKPDVIKKKIETSITALQEVGAPPSWVFNNHDVVRSIDRLDLGLTNHGDTTFSRQGDVTKLNIARGTLRALSATLMTLSLPGGTYLYQGEEIGLPEVRDIPEDRLTDPRWKMSEFKDRGRDGCRVPLPWKTDSAGGFGFSSNAAMTCEQLWLPQSSWMGKYSVQSQEGVEGSTLSIYQNALAIRKQEPGLGDGPMEWIEAGKDVVAYSRPGKFACYINFGSAIEIPTGSKVLISSGPLQGNSIPTDTAVWLRLP